MKMLIMALILLAPTASFAQELELHFEEALINKCTKEVEALGCGKSTGSLEEAFMKCIDVKIFQLSEDCRIMHKTLRTNSHSH